jgi:hypothetical protein
MKLEEVPDILKEVEAALTAMVFPPQVEEAVQKLLNLVEQLVAQQRARRPRSGDLGFGPK